MEILRPIGILVVAEKMSVSERVAQALHRVMEEADCAVAALDAAPAVLAHRPPDILFCEPAVLDSLAVRAGALERLPVVLLSAPDAKVWSGVLRPVAVVDVTALRPRELEKAVRAALQCRQLFCHSRLREYELMINRSPAVVFVRRVAAGWPVDFVTENVRQFGYTPEDFVSGRVSWAQATHPDDLARLEGEVAGYLREKKPAFFEEYRLLDGDGQVRWVEERTMAVFDSGGNITHYQGILLDTTERRQALDALEQARSVYENLVLTAPDAILNLDSEGRVLFASPLTCEVLGFSSAGELTGRDVLDVVVAGDRDRARAALSQAVEKGLVSDVALELSAQDGSRLHVECSATAMRSGGRVTVTVVGRNITERLAMEEELRQTREHFKCILDNSRDVAYKLDVRTGKYEYVSPSISMFGISAEEFVEQGYKAYLSRIHPEDEARLEGLYDSYFKDPLYHPLPATIEYRVRDYAGEYRWIADTFRAVFDDEGRFVAEVGNIRDITDAKNAEALTLAQRDFALRLAACGSLDAAVSLCLDTALELSGMEAGGLYLCDRPTGGFRLVSAINLSDEMVREVSYECAFSPRVQLLMRGKPVYCRYGDLAVAQGEALSREGLKGLAIVPVRHQNKTIASLNLGSRTKEEIALADRHALETIAAHAGSMLARLQADEDLRESEEKYRNLVENAYDGICIVQDRKLKYLNPQLAQMLGGTVERLVETSVSVYFQSESEAALVQSAASLPFSQAGPALFEARLLRRDGQPLEAEIKASPITFMNGRAALVLVRDVTERNKTLREVEEQRLEIVAASRMSELGMMASGVAHEINNPLAVISGVAEQLRELLGERGGELSGVQVVLAVEQVEKIARHAHRIERIIQNMKAFGRDGASDPVKTSSLGKVIGDALDLCEARFAAHGVRLDVAEVAGDVVLECRPAQIAQVLVNLLSNAYDAVEKMPERWVRIEYACRGGEIELAVVDSGPGMGPYVREQALRPFFSTKEFGKGSGLGLTISKGIVENHNGSLEIDHVHPHTRVVVRLPVKQPQNDAQGEPP